MNMIGPCLLQSIIHLKRIMVTLFHKNYHNEIIVFDVTHIHLPYNAILGYPAPAKFMALTHHGYNILKMSGSGGTAMLNKKSEAQPEDEQPVSDTQIVAGVLKEHSSSSTFLSTMGYQSRFGRSRTSTSRERVRELEERVEQQKRDAIEAHEMYQLQLTERVKAQESALEGMQNKQQQEMQALMKGQEEKMKSYEKKQEEADNLISFLLRKHATQN
ncbi:hypothetical protein ZWY2020_024311 [Hordeum vulgare]|nr:hypothetical protein ZWY2020_024311 [Hordeum vulgare]